MRPLAIDLYAGLGGWSDGLLAEGYDCVGFDIERHQYDEHRYPAQLVVQDVLTLHGSQFRNAALIVASPPCQAYSYRAMPWKKAKALPPPENTMFDACFRIQREACEAAGRHIPLIVENVRGAQPYVGRARWNYGSFYLWGDVPALMPTALNTIKVRGFRFDGVTKSCFQQIAANHIRDGAPHTRRLTNPGEREVGEGRKGAGAGAEWFDQNLCRLPSASPRRKAASAMIAKIPLPLSRHIAAVYLPRG